MTGRNNTKQDILEVSLELFSTQGYEATSVSQIAARVGIRKASLYSHFASKQEILDSLLKDVLEQYNNHSIFANSDRYDLTFATDKKNITPEDAIRMIMGQINYIIHDSTVSRARKMLTIEQFQNPQMAALQTKQNYTDVMRYFTEFVRFLIGQGKLENGDPELMAAQLCLPITVWINLCDREPERENEVTELIERHIRQFFAVNEKKGDSL